MTQTFVLTGTSLGGQVTVTVPVAQAADTLTALVNLGFVVDGSA